MLDLIDLLRDAGGFATAAQLRAATIPRSVISAALEAGAITRVRRGWYALAAVREADRRAVATGGVLSCVSLLDELGLWVVTRPSLHVAVDPSAAVAASRHATLHWKKWPAFGHASPSRDSIEAAILNMLTCIPDEDAVVTMDSAVNSGAISLGDLDGLRSLAPAGKRRLFDLVDPGAQSGLETRIRLAARRMRVQVRAQVLIPGIGHVDNLIGERLVIESDGVRYHASSEQRQIDLQRGDHLWSPKQRRRRNLG